MLTSRTRTTSLDFVEDDVSSVKKPRVDVNVALNTAGSDYQPILATNSSLQRPTMNNYGVKVNDLIYGASSVVPSNKKKTKRINFDVNSDEEYNLCSIPIMENILKLRDVHQSLILKKFNLSASIENCHSNSLVNVAAVTAQINSLASQSAGIELFIAAERKRLNAILNECATMGVLERLIDDFEREDQRTLDIWGVSSFDLDALKTKLDMIRRFGSAAMTDKVKDKILIEVLDIYRADYGCFIPTDYVVPTGEKFPKYAWSLPVGKWLVTTAENEAQPRKFKHNMITGPRKGMGDKQIISDAECVLEAVVAFHTLNRHSSMSVKYVVPTNSTKYPKVTHGARLGKWLNEVIQKCQGDDDKLDGHMEEKLINCWDMSSLTMARHTYNINCGITNKENADSTFLDLIKVIRTSLKLFLKDPNGIYAGYVVPKCNWYPSECWGLKLGVILTTSVSRVSSSV